jgi:hypothetical protein
VRFKRKCGLSACGLSAGYSMVKGYIRQISFT